MNCELSTANYVIPTTYPRDPLAVRPPRTVSTRDSQSFGPGFLRACFVRARARLSATLRARAERDGLVARRGWGPGTAAPSIVACNREIALLRFVTCEREPFSTILTSAPSATMIRSRVGASNARELATSNRSSALDDVLFACCPPGPPGVSNRQRSSLSGMSNLVIVSSHSTRTILQSEVDA